MKKQSAWSLEMQAILDRIDRAHYINEVVLFSHRLVRRYLGLKSPEVIMIGRGEYATPVLPVIDEAADRGDISWDESDELARADVIIFATSADGSKVFVLGEIAPTTRQRHLNRSIHRAAILERATNTRTIPVTIGVIQQPMNVGYPSFLMYNPDADNCRLGNSKEDSCYCWACCVAQDNKVVLGTP